ncbi:TIGR00266 family protein [Roseiconus lacunae]|uniref:TIGR00266 family protein n=1 Tax=Roseiconus lacunae TaxID=2605694 RepID=UPI001F1BA09D
MEFNCPMCGKHYQAGDDLAGKMVNCRTCGHAFPVPRLTSNGGTSTGEDPFANESLASGVDSTTNSDDRFAAGEVQVTSAPVTMRGGQSSDGVARTSDEIDYEIFGHETQYVEITLDPGEQTIAEAGALMYMTSGIEMATVFGDPSKQDSSLFGKVLSAGKRALTGEALFMTTFTNQSNARAQVAFGAPYPGRCIPLHLDQLGGEVICQKDAFLCGARGITVDIAFQKKIGAGLFGGEGFIMQRLRGDGIGVIHAGGTMMYRELDAGETIRLDTGCLVAMGPTVNYDVEFVGGLKNAFFGGEGLFLATVRGPGPVWLQSLPFSRFAGRLAAAIPSGGNTRKGEGSLLGGFGEMFMGD